MKSMKSKSGLSGPASKINWKNETRNLADLRPAPYNPRAWTEDEHERLAESLGKFNLVDPLVINLDNTIIGGHFRYMILKSLGVLQVEVRVPDRLLTPAEEKELNIRLNKNQGQFDLDKLGEFDEEFLAGIGFGADELSDIFDQLQVKPVTKEVRPYNKYHVLLSCDIEDALKLRAEVNAITKIKDLEIADGQN